MSGVRLGTWGAVRVSSGVVLTALGSLLLVASIPAALAAGGIQSSVGRAGVVAAPLGELRAAPGDAAVIVDGVSARLVAPAVPSWLSDALALVGTDVTGVLDDIGQVTLVASPQSGGAFLGVAPAEAVDDYLDGTPYSVASGARGEWVTVSVPGSGAPAAPQEQSWWAAQGTGDAPELPGAALDGQTLVLMRADAAPGPQAALRLEYRVPGADRALILASVGAASAALGGLMLVLLGGALVVGRRTGARA